MLESRSTWPCLLVVCLALCACKLFKMTPEKACAKTGELLKKSGQGAVSSEDEAKCVTKLAKMQKEHPTQYECSTKCLKDGKDTESVGTCMAACSPEESSETAENSDEGSKPQPVDSLTPSDVQSKLESAYRGQGIDISGEKANSAGWSADVTLGEKGPTGEIHIYKVILVDVNGKADGEKVAANFQTGDGVSKSRVGEKKVLFVQCLYQRLASESGMPKKCSSYDSEIEAFTDEIARYED